MAMLVCRDYGFECDYRIEGEDEEILEKFGRHSAQRHGIEYSSGALKQILNRKSHKGTQDSGIILSKKDIKKIALILDCIYSTKPKPPLVSGLSIDHEDIQKLLLKIHDSLET